MPSPLDFPSTAGFRNALIARNLNAYTVPGVYSPPSGPRVYEIIQRDLSVVDSDDTLILNDPFADLLYPLNAYGPLGGFNKNINAGNLAGTKSNLGPYDYQDANLLTNSEPYKKDAFGQNIFNPSPNTTTFTVQNNVFPRQGGTVKFYTSYGVPITFVPSTYSPYQILLQDDPQGDNGRLSQDSYLANLGATTLRNEFRERIAREIQQNTVGRINLPNAISDPFEALQILQGKRPLIERDWVITRPDNILLRSVDFATRLSGTYYPASVIPGEYFQFSEQNLSLFGQISAAFNNGKSPYGGLIGKTMGLLSKNNNPSQIFLNNTGGGQKSQLFFLLAYNRFTPEYERGSTLGVIDNVRDFFRNILDNPTQGGYYVGSKNSEPSMIDSPLGELPVNSFGQEVQSPVYGPDALSKVYEGDQNLKFGLNGLSITDGGGTAGGLTWVSPKYNNAGFKATVGGGQGPEDPEYNIIKSQIETSLSNQYNFKTGSILDDTQRLVDSTPNGAKRLSHVGNAINQLSKVFNDGYREITKGSSVVGYTNPTKGIHAPTNVYCRVFTKDTPYYTYADLQKTDGNIRKYTYSVLDNTYNLNIAPLRNPGSTNIVNGQVKKYMFSIENLAWRTSNRPGYTWDDLPECEKGPNRGRIMWFPPYDLSFSENTTPSFQDNDFIGRPEPVYTYKNTKRSGTLSWKIVVDHPSILNTIVNKELKNENTVERINSIVDSFFAGCLKYDIYELAKRWNTIPKRDLFVLQQIITNPNAKDEDIRTAIADTSSVKVTAQDANGGSNGATQTPSKQETPSKQFNFNKFVDLGFYFANDQPNPKTTDTTTNANFKDLYDVYTSSNTRNIYRENSGTPQKTEQTQNFFDNVVIDNFNVIQKELVEEIRSYFNTFGANTTASVTITLIGSASSPQTIEYNQALSQRRISSVINYFNSLDGFKELIDNGRLVITQSPLGETPTVTPKKSDGTTYVQNTNCTNCCTNPNDKYSREYSPQAMACRRVFISKIEYTQTPTNIADNFPTNTEAPQTNVNPEQPRQPRVPQITTQQRLRDGISKKILRSLLSECDYFEIVKETNPMFYDSMKEKIKYFTPAFHSITPEGLNSRLTFLQQCTRPGDTIPVIGTDGKPRYDNAVNTAFGAPPVLILRVGDFYHTKIIPTSLQIAYEPLLLDINPEGIGVQPMLAKITLSFNFIGGEGLKEPIDKLQNALSFNYYANTEMYDERADFTDESFRKIDEELIKSIADEPPTNKPTSKIENDGGSPIGEVQQASGITYQKIMNSFYDSGQAYINTVYNKFEQINNDYNLSTLQISTSSSPLFNSGKGLEFSTSATELGIVGKGISYQLTSDKLFKQIEDDINSVNGKNDSGDEFIKLLYINSIKKTTIKQIKNNLINQVRLSNLSYNTNLTQVINELVNSQLNLINVMSKIDYVATNSDGYIKPDQSLEIYSLSSTTEVQVGGAYSNTYDELVGDYNSGLNKLKKYYDFLKTKKYVENPYNLNSNENPAGNNSLNNVYIFRFYVGMSKIILTEDLFQQFKNNIMTQEVLKLEDGEKALKVFDKYFNGFKEVSKKQKETEKNYFDTTIRYEYDRDYKEWNPFVKDKVRNFNFSINAAPTDEQKTRLQNIYKNGNSNTNTRVFNGKKKFN